MRRPEGPLSMEGKMSMSTRVVPELHSLVGQLLITGLPGTEIDGGFRERFVDCPSGGFTLFGRNVSDAASMRRLTSGIADAVGELSPGAGRPIIAIDQEGGSLSPARALVPSLPGNMGLGAANDTAAALSAGYITGLALHDLGITVNLAPVLDLASDPINPVVSTRSFGDDPVNVAFLGAAYADGLRRAGLMYTAKHFPGHGSVQEDSHSSLPTCNMPADELRERHMLPFREVMKVPNCAVLAAHVLYTALDPVWPASLSPRIISEVLRGEMGFDGVVLTDCMEMAAVRTVASVGEGAVRAVEAGADLVLVSHTPELQAEAFQALLKAVVSGRIPIDRVEASTRRIARWKERASVAQPAVDGMWSQEQVSDAAVSFVAGDAEAEAAWQFGRGRLVLVLPESERITLAEDADDAAALSEELVSAGVDAVCVRVAADPSADQIEGALAAIVGVAVDGARVALVVRNNGNSPSQARLAAEIESRWPLLFVGVREPRETVVMQAALKRKAPAVFTYSTERAVLRTAAMVLAGAAPAIGVMPVTI